MAGDDNTPETPEDELLEAGEDGDEGDEDDASESEQLEALQKAASEIEIVVLPLACTNEGKGAPLSMGVQRWWAQELARTGLKAAAPVFTAIADQQGRKVPALLVYRDAWNDERALQGAMRFPNAKRVVTADFHVSEQRLDMKVRLGDIHLDPNFDASAPAETGEEIGRASCRERVSSPV